MIPAINGVACPRCKRTETTPLAREGDRQRHQCGACSESFWAPVVQELVEASPAAPAAARFAHVPIAAPDPGDLHVLRDEPAGRCTKCEKPYRRLGKRYEAHVASCDGVQFIQPKKRVRVAVFTTPHPPDVGKIYDQSIAALRARRASLEAEIRGLDGAILEIEKLRGAGGAAQAPFSAGSRVTACSP